MLSVGMAENAAENIRGALYRITANLPLLFCEKREKSVKCAGCGIGRQIGIHRLYKWNLVVRFCDIAPVSRGKLIF